MSKQFNSVLKRVFKSFPFSFVKFLQFNSPPCLNYVGQKSRIFTIQFSSVLIEMFKIQQEDKIQFLICQQRFRTEGTTSNQAKNVERSFALTSNGVLPLQ